MNINESSMLRNTLRQTNIFAQRNSNITDTLGRIADRAMRSAEFANSVAPQAGRLPVQTLDMKKRQLIAFAHREFQMLDKEINFITQRANESQVVASQQIEQYEAIIERLKSHAKGTHNISHEYRAAAEKMEFKARDTHSMDSLIAENTRCLKEISKNVVSNTERAISIEPISPKLSRAIKGLIDTSFQNREKIISYIRNGNLTNFVEGRRLEFTIPSMEEFDSDDIIGNEIAFWQSVIDETHSYLHQLNEIYADRLNRSIQVTIYNISLEAARLWGEDGRFMDFSEFQNILEKSIDDGIEGWDFSRLELANTITKKLAVLFVSAETLLEDMARLRDGMNNISKTVFGIRFEPFRLDMRT